MKLNDAKVRNKPKIIGIIKCQTLNNLLDLFPLVALLLPVSHTTHHFNVHNFSSSMLFESQTRQIICIKIVVANIFSFYCGLFAEGI